MEISDKQRELQAESQWTLLRQRMSVVQLQTLITRLGMKYSEVRTDYRKSFALLRAWEADFAAEVRRGYRTGVPMSASEVVARVIELALELNLGRAKPVNTVPVRLRFGMTSRGKWCCLFYSRSNTESERPWRMYWRDLHEECFLHLDATGYKANWTTGFGSSVYEDARAFSAAVPALSKPWSMWYDVNYCVWLSGLLAHARLGAIPAFYWPGYDEAELTETRLCCAGKVAGYPLPRSPWG